MLTTKPLTAAPVAQQPANSAAFQKPQSSLGFLRRLCLAVSNAVLQFPVAFEWQQRALRQPTLLRYEVKQELADILSCSTDFKVLDYGCGSGTYSGLFSHDRYVGIDCNQAMLGRAARQHPHHTFIQAADLSGISAQLEDLSHVLMIGVVHHLSDEALISILSSVPRKRPVRLLTVDTLRCTSGPGRFIQMFERGEYLRTEREHLKLLGKVADEISYKRVPYGKYFELAVFRGIIKREIG